MRDLYTAQRDASPLYPYDTLADTDRTRGYSSEGPVQPVYTTLCDWGTKQLGCKLQMMSAAKSALEEVGKYSPYTYVHQERSPAEADMESFVH